MPQRGPTNGLMDMVSSEMEDWISNQDNRISSQESATRTGRLPESPATSNFNATNTDDQKTIRIAGVQMAIIDVDQTEDSKDSG
uniref:CACTA en-spm transposon protein n=1 Tax=Caenorhabditis tropicalis TaxID=1561998 RepID=A0A1I7UIM7_9PELO